MAATSLFLFTTFAILVTQGYGKDECRLELAKNSHIIGGKALKDISEENKCKEACSILDTCTGIDFK